MALSEVIREVSETSMRLTFGLMSMLFCFWAWILVNVPTLFNLAVIYLFLISGASIIGGLAFASNFAYPFATLGFPTLKELPETTFVGALIGAAWIYISTVLSALVPPMQTSIYRELPFTVALIFAVAASLTEEIMARATILPTTIRIFKSKTAGTLFTSIFFSALHWAVYQAQPAALVSAFLFSMAVSTLVLHYRTGWVAGAAHTTYNLIILYFTLQQ
jgi:membrane protease YdiL (CAAX protease family)